MEGFFELFATVLVAVMFVSYFEVGTVLTSNHGHGALFGVFGMLALAVVVFCLRSLVDDAAWAGAEGWILMSGTFHTLEWARSAADGVFLVFGVVPFVLAVAVLFNRTRRRES